MSNDAADLEIAHKLIEADRLRAEAAQIEREARTLLIERARRDEREACAAIAAEEPEYKDERSPREIAGDIVKKIRARGPKRVLQFRDAHDGFTVLPARIDTPEGVATCVRWFCPSLTEAEARAVADEGIRRILPFAVDPMKALIREMFG